MPPCGDTGGFHHQTLDTDSLDRIHGNRAHGRHTHRLRERPGPGLGTTLDAATTAYALDHGYSEANPLLSPIGDPYLTALAAVGVKQGIKYSLHEYGGLSEDCAHHGVETAAMGAGGWNLAILAGAATGPGLIVGALFGAGYWLWSDGDEACR
ncbi:hypothetical protein CUR86_17725 [Salinicola acroporae]|uniref:Uncharacterized protein n=2 Tax=Salinicola acroporae TaxID=1541440 RepID=A0ABT6I8Y8_9GAMM|nr:hypothetical protein [Salinicola acroporae]